VALAPSEPLRGEISRALADDVDHPARQRRDPVGIALPTQLPAPGRVADASGIEERLENLVLVDEG
jgi:hypothetical protein